MHFKRLSNRPVYFLWLFLLIFMLPGIRLFGYQVSLVEAKEEGSLSGQVTFSGMKPPSNEVFNVAVTPDFCGSSIAGETYLVNSDNGGIENTIVSLEGVGRLKFKENLVVKLDLSKCHFVPHILAMRKGDTLEIQNSDPVPHSSHLWYQKDDSTFLNVVMPSNGKNIKKTISQTGMLKVKCDIHTFMNAFIVIFDHPYFSITGQDGRFHISEIPPGKYKIKVWHEKFDLVEKEIVIKPNEEVIVSLELGSDNLMPR